MSTWPTAREWWNALRWVALTITLLVAATLAGSFVSYERVVTKGHPWLPAKRCTGCMMCGMTRSFCALSHGRWREAYDWNPGGPALYVVAWAWTGCAAFVLLRGSARRVGGSPSIKPTV